MGEFRTRGQAAALASVRRWVEAVEAPHALLFVGPDGVGKTTLALDLVAGLCCLAEEPAQRPCRTCAACRKLEHGNHPDLHRLAPAGAGGQIRIDEVRRLLSDLALLPAEARVRAALIEGAHRLNPDAQNALLKLLEEAPPGVVIVLTAAAESLLLETVVSRCQRVRLGPVAAGDVATLLVERGVADAPRAAALAHVAGGRPGVALALAGDPDAVVAEGRMARTLLDLAAADRRTRLAAATELLTDARRLLSKGSDDSTPETGASRASATPAERRQAALRLIETWRAVARDVAVTGLGLPDAARRLDLADELHTAATRIPGPGLVTFLARLDRLAAAVEAYANPELVVDALLLSWPRATPA
jgi:DNA polymerase III delta' subunit